MGRDRMSIYGQAFNSLSPASQRAVVGIYNSATKFLQALGTRIPRDLHVADNAQEASDALEDYASVSATVGGPSIDVLIGRNAPNDAPSFDELVEAYRVHPAADSIQRALRALRAAYDDARDVSVAGNVLSPLSMRAYLSDKLQTLPRASATNPNPTPSPVEPAPARSAPAGDNTARNVLLAIAAAIVVKTKGKRRGR